MKLTTPVQANGKEISELTFRKPNGKDIAENGVPFSSEVTKSGGQRQHIDSAAIAGYISSLAGIPPSSVNMLSAEDFMSAMTEIMSFFVPSEIPQRSLIDTTS